MTSRSHKATNNDLHLLESQLRNEVHRLSAKSHTTSIRKKQTSDTHIRYDAKTGKRIQQDKPRRRTKRKTVQMAQASVANMQIEEAYDAACLDLQGDYNETIETDNESSENHILQQLMVEIEADLSKVSRMNNRKTGNWTERMEPSEESWEAIRPTLFEYSVASAAPPKHKDCFHCGERSGVVRCWQCEPSCMLCAQCDIKIHTMVALHNRDIWTGSCFLSVSPTQYVDENTHDIVEIECPIPLTVPKVCPSCGVKGDMDVYKSGEAKRIIVTMSGRYDLSDAHVVCLACHTVFADVFHETVSEGFWPGSAGRRLAYLFHQDVFKFFIHLKFFNPGMSQSGFLKTLEQISLLNGRIPTINPTAFSKALSEWKYCQYEKQKLKGVPLLDCPACYSNQHSVHIDGNKKLYRFSKVPRGSRKSYYDGAFIAKNEDVDDHLALIGYFDETLMRDDQCGSTRWKAAKAVSRTMPSLDETGLEVGGCRHAIAQKAVNMFHGEIYGYAHYLHTKVFAPRNVSYFWEDIVCKYWPWARNKEHLFPGSMDMIPCLSVMHGKAHSWPCGIIWGGRWQDGAAGGSGEDMEQLFSNLSRWAFSTKMLSAAGRDDALTEAVMFWNERKVLGLPKHLSLRIQKARAVIEEMEEVLKEIEEKIGMSLTTTTLQHFKANLCQIAHVERSTDTSSVPLSLAGQYYKLLQQIKDANYLRSFVAGHDVPVSIAIDNNDLHISAQAFADAVTQKANALHDLENRLGLTNQDERESVLQRGRQEVLNQTKERLASHLEMLHLSIMRKQETITKDTTSSKQRQALRKAIAQDKKKISEVVTHYNSVIQDLQPSQSLLTTEEVTAGIFPWSALSGVRNCIAVQLQYEAVDTYMKLCRFQEEERQVIREMTSFLLYFKDRVLSSLHQSLAETETLLCDDEVSTEYHDNGSLDSHDDELLNHHHDGFLNCCNNGSLNCHDDGLLNRHDDGLLDHEDNENCDQGSLMSKETTCKYSSHSKHPSFLRGKCALFNEGILYASSMLKAGLKSFSVFLTHDHDDISEADVCDQPTGGECDVYTTDDDADTYLSD